MKDEYVSNAIANKIVARLESAIKNNEVFYWVKPWAGGPRVMCNYETQVEYRGINRLLLSDFGEFLTFNKLQEYNKKNGTQYHIRKDEHGEMIVYFDFVTKKDPITREPVLDKDGNEVKVGFLKKYTVFDRRQIIDRNNEVLPSKFSIKEYDHTEIERQNQDALSKFEKIVNAYCQKYNIAIDYIPAGEKAFYSPSENKVQVPDKKGFSSIYDYVQTVFHELSHSTGKILGRDMTGYFGGQKYATEEIVADISAQILIQKLGITDDRKFKDNDLAYLTNWASHLKEKPRTILSAAQSAEKAVDLIEEAYKEWELSQEEIVSEPIEPENIEQPLPDPIPQPEEMNFTALGTDYYLSLQGTNLTLRINDKEMFNLEFGTVSAAKESMENFRNSILNHEREQIENENKCR